MIPERFIDLVAGFLSFVAGLLDFPAVPGVVLSVPGYVSTVGGWMSGTGAWVPWSVVSTMVALWASCLVGAVAIRVVRIVASFLTAGGGGAA